MILNSEVWTWIGGVLRFPVRDVRPPENADGDETYQLENWADVEQEIKALIARYPSDFDGISVDHAFYRGLDDAGVGRLYTVRLRGWLIGFASFVVSDHPLKSGQRWAFGSALWIKPDHRRRYCASLLLASAQRRLEAEKVVGISISARQRDLGARRALNALRFAPIETTFEKEM
jgi:hypothetical protein